MISDEIAAAIAKFFDGGKGPSHDELDRLFARFGLAHADPREPGTTVGKMKRIRGVLGFAVENEPERGQDLVKALVATMRASGCFRPTSDFFPGQESVAALRDAFRNVGYDLDAEGNIRPRQLENLDGLEMTDALWSYVRRARTGAADNELLIGTAKNLEEAVARHVLKERAGSYPTYGGFPMLLGQAFTTVGLVPTDVQLDRDPYKAVQQALFLLGTAINRLRNERGDGHGRPEPSTATALQGRLATVGASLVGELLLVALRRGN